MANDNLEYSRRRAAAPDQPGGRRGCAPVLQDGWRDFLAEGRLARFVLVCLGVWLGAAESLVTATIMPSVAGDLGGHAYLGWATAGFLTGTVLAVASAGKLAERCGLRTSAAVGAGALTAGCIASALAPEMAVFLAGRLLQGIGGGWISGFAMVAAGLLFPDRHLARIFASATAVWALATLLGPLIGGAFAGNGQWRAVFWLFALQAVLFGFAAMALLARTAAPDAGVNVPWRQLGLIGLGIAAIAVADAIPDAVTALFLVVAGLWLLAWTMRFDRRSPQRLFPRDASDLRTVAGAGYAAMFLLTMAATGFLVYGPALLLLVLDLTPLQAGYVVAVQAMAWTLAAFPVAGVSPLREGRWIRLGSACILAGTAMMTLSMSQAALFFIVLAAAITGAGFGLSSSLMNRRVLGTLPDEERAIGSSALVAVRQLGGAIGAAGASMAANAAGFGPQMPAVSAAGAGGWICLAMLPAAAAGAWAAWRMPTIADRTHIVR